MALTGVERIGALGARRRGDIEVGEARGILPPVDHGFCAHQQGLAKAVHDAEVLLLRPRRDIQAAVVLRTLGQQTLHRPRRVRLGQEAQAVGGGALQHLVQVEGLADLGQIVMQQHRLRHLQHHLAARLERPAEDVGLGIVGHHRLQLAAGA